MQATILKPLEAALAAVLEEAGYQKNGRHWRGERAETILAVHLQLSR